MLGKRRNKIRPILKKRGQRLYKRIAVPGSGKFVTLKTPDVRDHVDIFYNGHHYFIKTRDILKMNSLSDVLRKVKTIRNKKSKRIVNFPKREPSFKRP